MPRYCPLCNKGGSGNGRWGVNLVEIEKAFSDAGMLAPDIRDLANDHLTEAIYLAPVRTGRLKREHYKWIGVPPGNFTRSYYVGTKAEYARFLLGTAGGGAGFIYPKRGKFLEIRPAPYSWFSPRETSAWGKVNRFKEKVRGQPRHPKADWLAEAAEEAFALNGVSRLGGYKPGLGR